MIGGAFAVASLPFDDFLFDIGLDWCFLFDEPCFCSGEGDVFVLSGDGCFVFAVFACSFCLRILSLEAFLEIVYSLW